MNTSNYLKPRIESFDMTRLEFLDLLELFVSEDWQNHETYNSFIRGFGEAFDDFNAPQASRFISLLVDAGLNQRDIFEAVLEKVDQTERFISEDAKRQTIMRMITSATEGDILSSEAFNTFISKESLEKHFKNDADTWLASHLQRDVNINDTIKLLRGIIARADLTQDSAINDIVSVP